MMIFVHNVYLGFHSFISTMFYNYICIRFYSTTSCYRGKCYGPVSVCLSVCPSHASIVSK